MFCIKNPHFMLLWSVLILSLLSTPPQVASKAKAGLPEEPEWEVEFNSPSPAVPQAQGQNQDLIFLPPSLLTEESSPSSPKPYHSLRHAGHRRQPLYEDFLDSHQKRVLDAAEKNFGLLYNVFPVKRDSRYETSTSENESDQIEAFEVLCGIVGRSIANAIICSAGLKNSTVWKELRCDRSQETINYGHDTSNEEDSLCSPFDPDSALSEECDPKIKGEKLRSMKMVTGPALDLSITVFSTRRPESSSPTSVKLPSNGALRDAIDRKIWKVDAPTKIIFTLVPYEFSKGPQFIEKLNRKMITAFVKKYGSSDVHNIVLVEWPEIFMKRLSITQLSTRFLITAEKIARIILRWQRKNQIQLDNIHFIGTSLGAHLAGVVGDIIKGKSDGQQVDRITGLDPIGWGFEEVDGIEPEHELTNDDASFVDVIHTSSPDANFPYIHYGSSVNRGTVDFYPNNGRAQYCGKMDGLCHHFYSVILYIASITGTNFSSCKCSSWDDFIIRRKCSPCVDSARMGEHTDRENARGVYFLVTA